MKSVLKAEREKPHHRWMTPIALGLLGTVVAIGLSGSLGGRGVGDTATAGDATLTIHGPTVIRNGEFGETIIAMSSTRPIDNLALEIDEQYWREVTINTMIPSAERESITDGTMRFEFGPLDAGATAQIKIDAQVNPHRFGPSTGDFVLFDGDRELVRLSRDLWVMP